jgi:hypothetical protein
MVWIRTIPPPEASGELHGVYQAIAFARGGVADVHRAQSLNPRTLRAISSCTGPWSSRAPH